MPQNTNNIPQDDEDILDLTVVAAPGRQSGTQPGAAPFGADLDALLDSLSADGSVNPPLPAAPRAAPIADQTPVAHKVDPHEEMAMPETADIDSLLAELGVDIPAEPAAAPAPKPAAGPEPAVRPAPLAEFDGLLAQAQAAEARKAAEEAAPVPPAPQPQQVPQPVAESVAEPGPAAEAGDGADEPGEPDEPDDGDSLNLDELDALLDDILATAPEMTVPAQPAASAGTVAAPDPAPEMPAPLAEEPEAVAEPPLPDAVPVPEVIPVPDQALIPSSVPDPALVARIQRLEEAVEVLETENNNPVTENMIETMIERAAATMLDAKIAALFGPGSKVMDDIVSATVAALTAKDGDSEHAGAFRENLERMAAAAAAKVIREEIAALMNE